MRKTKIYTFVALLGLMLVLGAWLISLIGSNLTITTADFTNLSDAAQAPATTTIAPAMPIPWPITPPFPTETATETPTPSPTPITPLPGTTAEEQEIAANLFQAINTSRAENGLPALQWSVELASGARKHNLQMAAANHISHQLPGEPDIPTRITQDGVKWTWCGENIGYTSDATTSGVLSIHDGMMAEQPPDNLHRKNLLNTRFTMVGVDVYIDSNHKLWLTEDFAD